MNYLGYYGTESRHIFELIGRISMDLLKELKFSPRAEDLDAYGALLQDYDRFYVWDTDEMKSLRAKFYYEASASLQNWFEIKRLMDFLEFGLKREDEKFFEQG